MEDFNCNLKTDDILILSKASNFSCGVNLIAFRGSILSKALNFSFGVNLIVFRGNIIIIIIIISEFVYRNNLSACQACCYD